jgi:hypothetical protein
VPLSFEQPLNEVRRGHNLGNDLRTEANARSSGLHERDEKKGVSQSFSCFTPEDTKHRKQESRQASDQSKCLRLSR